VLGVTALASFMMALDGQVITTAFATIRGEFGASVETLQWTVNGYNLTFAVLLLTGAALGDRFSRRAMFAAGIFLFTLASMACALSGSVETLIAARSAQGAGAALVSPLAMAILSGEFAKEVRARAFGMFSGITGCALIIGPAVGGFITETLGWRWIFWINLPIATIAIALVPARLRESFGPQAALDIPGLVFVAVAALARSRSASTSRSAGWLASISTVCGSSRSRSTRRGQSRCKPEARRSRTQPDGVPAVLDRGDANARGQSAGAAGRRSDRAGGQRSRVRGNATESEGRADHGRGVACDGHDPGAVGAAHRRAAAVGARAAEVHALAPAVRHDSHHRQGASGERADRGPHATLDPRFGRRTALTLPLLPPPQKN
jgi:hypothetical protein